MKSSGFCLAVACLFVVLITTEAGAYSDSLGIFADHQDVGITPEKGDATYDAVNKSYQVSGGGADIWSRRDAFHFVYKRLSGDAVFTADVQLGDKSKEQYRKAALMFRQSLMPDAAYVDAALHGDGMASLQYRPIAGAETLETRSKMQGAVRIRIERHTDQFTIAAGMPGQPLKSTGPVTIHLTDPVYVGFAVSSHDAGVLESAVFSNVELESGSGRKRFKALQAPARR